MRGFYNASCLHWPGNAGYMLLVYIYVYVYICVCIYVYIYSPLQFDI